MKGLVRTLDAQPEWLALVRSIDIEYRTLQSWIENEPLHLEEREEDYQHLRLRDQSRGKRRFIRRSPAEGEEAPAEDSSDDDGWLYTQELYELERARVLRRLRERGMADWIDLHAVTRQETNGPRRREGADALLSLVGRCPRLRTLRLASFGRQATRATAVETVEALVAPSLRLEALEELVLKGRGTDYNILVPLLPHHDPQPSNPRHRRAPA